MTADSASTSRSARAGARTAIASTLLLALMAGAARAHDTWLLPTPAHVKPGEAVRLEMTSGMAFPKRESPIRADRIASQGVRLDGREMRFGDPRENKKELLLTAKLDRPGVATVWVDLYPRTLDLTAEDVEHYFEEIGASASVRERWQSAPEPRRWRESYTKHVKTFVRVGTPAGDRSWSEPVGSAFELVPERDPTALHPGDELVVRLLRNGAPAVGVTVGLLRAGETKSVDRPSGEDGRVTFTIGAAGWYLLRSTDLRPAAGADLDWESDFATLTFEAQAAAKTAGGSR